MKSLLGVRHAAFATRDLPAALRFYQDVLGFRPYYVDSEDWAMLMAGDTSLSLIRAEKFERRGETARGGSHHSHLGLTVETRADVDLWHARLREMKSPSVGRTTEHRDGSYGFYFRDLDGNALELIFIPYRSHHLPPPAEGCVVLAHGSRDARWRATIEDLPQRLAAHAPGMRAAVAYMEMASPTLEEVLTAWAKDGLPERVKIFPLFFSGGGHVAKDLPELVARTRLLFPQTELVLQNALGEHPFVREALLAAIVLSI